MICYAYLFYNEMVKFITNFYIKTMIKFGENNPKQKRHCI